MAQIARCTVGFRSSSPTARRRVLAAFSAALHTTADDIAVEAEIRAPYDASNPHDGPDDIGHLADNIVQEDQGAFKTQVHSKAPYSAYQEFGTEKMAPQPFMTPAIMEVWPKQMEANMRDEMRKVVP